MRIALDDAAPLYRDAPEARKTRALAGELILTTLSAVGNSFRKLLEPPRRSKPTGMPWPTCFAPSLLSISESAITNHQMGNRMPAAERFAAWGR
jgi:hypothetical protein